MPWGDRIRSWDGLKQDIRFGARQIVRKPALPALVILLLALGIGINTAIFSVVKAVVLEPLPFESPEQLVMIWETDRRSSRIPVSGPNFLDWRKESRSFEHLVCYTPYQGNLTGGGEPERLEGAMVTAGMFELLGVSPSRGRTFLPEEEIAGRSEVAIISDGLWKRRFGADPAVLGTTLTFRGEARTVVGIMPAGFKHPCPWSIGRPTDVWTPLSLAILEEDGRDGQQFLALGRLAEGTTLEMAREEMNVITRRLEERYPETNENAGVRVAPVHEEILGRVGGQLMMLLGAAGLVLLIVCGNVAALLIAKATTRQTEVAVRSSLGASRPRLLRQFLTENAPLFLLGGGASVLLAKWGVDLLLTTIPSNIPRVQEISVDGWVIGFTLGISLLTGLFFGLVPALSASKANLGESLKQGRGASPVGHSRLRDALVVTQFALTLVLANGAALMLQSYWELRGMDHGFSTEGVQTMRLNLRGPRYEEQEQVRVFYEEALERIEALPGVRHAAAVSRLPLEGGTSSTAIIEGRESDFGREEGPLVEVKVITPDYFDAMGIPLLAGRKLTEQDSSLGRPGVVINQTMAGRIWPDESPIKKRFTFAPPHWVTVVGVVGDTRQWGLERVAIPETYFPYSPRPTSGMFSFHSVRFVVIRTDVDPVSLVPMVRQEILRVDEEQPVSDIRTTGDILDASIARRRFNTLLIGLFASMALILVAAGIYGVMSYFVSRRTHEIGVRMALGADRTRVLKLVLGEGLQLAAVGVAIGLTGVFATTSLTAGMLYGVSPTDPLTVTGGTLFLVAIGLLGTLVPARRATRVAPVAALRDE